MAFIHFDAIDEQGHKERDVYVNPLQVRTVTALAPYGKRERCRIAFAADDSLLVSGTAGDVCLKLDGREVELPPAPAAAAK